MNSTLIDSRQLFSDLDYWPPQRSEINPEGWLGQFDDEDRGIAEDLLSSFVYLNRRFTEQLFGSAFLELSAAHSDPQAWLDFRASAFVTFPGAEDQNPTDSGHEFARLSRDKLEIPQAHIFRPADLVRHLSQLDSRSDVVIVDDFLGSGEQFLETWKEAIYVSGRQTSLSLEIARCCGTANFVVAVATPQGVDALREEAPEVSVFAGNLLDRRDSARHHQTRAVSAEHRDSLEAVLRKYCGRAGGDPRKVWGHRELATTLAFEHGMPDSTLPIYSMQENWIPLRKR